jgi:filamentous hemagglutinin
LHGGTGSATGQTKIGVNFIVGQLNAGAAVAISAHALIDASAAVHAISATKTAEQGGGGNLSLKTSNVGKINLSGVDINIAGNFTASMHTGTFGHLTAGAIDLQGLGSGNHVKLTKAVVTDGTVTTWSAKATNGNLSINAGSMQMLDSSANATLALSATEQLGIQANYGTESTSRAGNLTLAGASMRVHPSVHIGGKLSAVASAGYADFTDVIANGGINISATGGNVDVGDLTSGGGTGITLTATNGGVTAGEISVTIGGNVNVTADHEIRILGIQDNNGSVTVNAGANQLVFGSSHLGAPSTVKAGDEITLTASGITFDGTSHATFKLKSLVGNIAVHGAIGSSEGSEHIGNGGVSMIASNGTVTLDHKIDVFGAVDIQAKSLNYTATGNLEIDATGGGITLDASIGAAKTPVAYGVTLEDSSGPVRLQRSIFTKGSISVNESRQNIHSSAGVFVGNGDSTSITLSAKGPISLAGAQVRIGAVSGGGHDAPITISADDGKASTSADKLTITASDGSVYIQPSGDAAFNGSVAKLSLNHNITLHAGGDVDITAVGGVNIRGAGGSSSPSSFGMRAYGQGANTSVSATGDVNITAGHDINVTGARVGIRAGFARAQIGGGSFLSAETNKTVNATAAADVNLTAGNDIEITATVGDISIQGGEAYGAANTNLKGQKATTNTSAVTTLTAGHDIDLAGQSITVGAGDKAGTGSGAFANNSSAAAKVSLHTDVDMAAANALSIKGSFVYLHGGNSAGGGAIGFNSSNSSIHLIAKTTLDASAKGATAGVNITSALSITAGKGGMLLSGAGSLNIDGGTNAAAALQMLGLGTAAHVSDAINASVTIASKGSLTLTAGGNLNVRGGNAGRAVVSFARSISGATITDQSNPTQISGRGDTVMNFTADTGVTLTAAGALDATAGGNLEVTGGLQDGASMSVDTSPVGTLGGTKIALRNGVAMIAGASLSFSAKTMQLHGGNSAGRSATINALGGTVSWTDDDSLSVTGRSVSLQTNSTDPSVAMNIIAGHAGGNFMTVNARNAAKANVSIDDAVAITATKGNIILGGNQLDASGGGSGGFRAKASASNGATATLDQDATLSFNASGLFSADFGNITIRGGRGGLEAAQAIAKAGGAVASLMTEDSVSITAGSAKLIGSTVTLAGAAGAYASGSTFGTPIIIQAAEANAFGKATATLKESGALNLAITGALTISASHAASHAITLQGGASSNGYGGSAFAQGAHAAANFSADGSLNIKAGSVTVTGNSGAGILVGSQGGAGHAGDATGLQAGNATYTEKNAINITATKALSLTATGPINIAGGSRAGLEAKASAASAGIATLTGSDGVNLKGGSVSLSAGEGINILGGDDAAAGLFFPSSDTVHASAVARGKSKASFTEQAGVNITAATAFSAVLTGSASNAGIYLRGGSLDGSLARVTGQTGGTAKLSVNAGIGITVTGATGTVVINTGSHTIAPTLNILGGLNAGKQMQVLASSGVASMDVLAGINIAAKGAVTIVTQGAAAQIVGQAGAGADGKNRAAGSGAKATTDVDAAVTLSGGSLSLTDTGFTLHVHGGHAGGSGQAVGFGISDEAIGPATATTTVDASVSLTATGNVNLTADDVFLGTGTSNANLAGSANVDGIFGGKASLTANAGVNVSGVNVTVQGRVSNMIGQTGVGEHVTVQGGSNAGNATLTANAGINVKATGTLSLNLSKGMAMDGGSFVAYHADVNAFGTGAKATYVAQSAVNLSAKTVAITTAASSGGLLVFGGIVAGQGLSMHADSGGAAKASLATQVNITASGNLSVKVAGTGTMGAGSGAANAADFGADHGKITLAATTGLSMTAGGNMKLSFASHSWHLAVGDTGSHQSINAGPGGTVSETLDESILFKSAAKLSLSNINGLTADSASFSSFPVVSITGTGKLSGLINGSISFLGKSVVSTNVTGFTHGSAADSTHDGIVYDTGVVVSGGLSKLSFAPMSLGTMQQDALVMSLETVMGAPAKAAQSTLFIPFTQGVNLQTGSAGCGATLLEQTGHCLLKY